MLTSNPINVSSHFANIQDKCPSWPTCKVHNTSPSPKSLDELIYLIRQEMGSKGLGSSDIDVNKIINYMEQYQSNAEEWERYVFYDPHRYTRNLVDDGNGEYNLILLVWGENQKSPIHDHAGSHCIMKILEGEVVESLYECPDQKEEHSKASEMKLKKDEVFGPNQVAYIHDKIGLHRVANPSSSRPAISLHLYSPPILECKTYEHSTGTARKSGRCTFYSKYGTKVDYE